MLVSAASRRDDAAGMCRLIAGAAPAILANGSREAKDVYVSSLLQILELYRYPNTATSVYPGGVLTFTSLEDEQDMIDSGSDHVVEAAFSRALNTVFGPEDREASVSRLSGYFQTLFTGAIRSAPANVEHKATPEQANRFLTSLVHEIAA